MSLGDRRRGHHGSTPGCLTCTSVADTADDLIWYASYGSNCLSARFATYLTGGVAEGATKAERGARNPSPPVRSEACWFPNGTRFLGDAGKWGGGGVAFLDHESGGRAPGRRYLITRGQFEDVAAQESRRDVAPIPIEDLVPGVVLPVGEGFYDGLLRFDDVAGVPVVTFTSPRPLRSRSANPPSAAYIGTILRGLLEVHSTHVDELVDALLDAPGVAAGWGPAELAALATK